MEAAVTPPALSALPRWALLEANRRVRDELAMNPAYNQDVRDRIARELVRLYRDEAALHRARFGHDAPPPIGEDSNG